MTSIRRFSFAEKRALESSMSQDDCDCQGYKGTEGRLLFWGGTMEDTFQARPQPASSSLRMEKAQSVLAPGTSLLQCTMLFMAWMTVTRVYAKLPVKPGSVVYVVLALETGNIQESRARGCLGFQEPWALSCSVYTDVNSIFFENIIILTMKYWRFH